MKCNFRGWSKAEKKICQDIDWDEGDIAEIDYNCLLGWYKGTEKKTKKKK